MKPEFWTDEKVVELSPFARLLFIGLWNFSDDYGRMPFSPRRIKMQILPADDVNISELFGELRGKDMVSIYSIENMEYLQVNNFSRHQKVDKRHDPKYPPPPNSTESPRGLPLEGKGKEGKGMEKEETTYVETRVSTRIPACPKNLILDLYHQMLPVAPRVIKWTSSRDMWLRSRWREHPDLELWRQFFEIVSKSKFLTGRAKPSPDRKPFIADLEWLIRPGNFAKVMEGKYDD